MSDCLYPRCFHAAASAPTPLDAALQDLPANACFLLDSTHAADAELTSWDILEELRSMDDSTLVGVDFERHDALLLARETVSTPLSSTSDAADRASNESNASAGDAKDESSDIDLDELANLLKSPKRDEDADADNSSSSFRPFDPQDDALSPSQEEFLPPVDLATAPLSKALSFEPFPSTSLSSPPLLPSPPCLPLAASAASLPPPPPSPLLPHLADEQSAPAEDMAIIEVYAMPVSSCPEERSAYCFDLSEIVVNPHLHPELSAHTAPATVAPPPAFATGAPAQARVAAAEGRAIVPNGPSTGGKTQKEELGVQWDAREDAIISFGVTQTGRACATKEGSGRVAWGPIVDSLRQQGYIRTISMVRNRWYRINKAKSAATSKQNRCRRCGQMRKGHSCPLLVGA